MSALTRLVRLAMPPTRAQLADSPMVARPAARPATRPRRSPPPVAAPPRRRPAYGAGITAALNPIPAAAPDPVAAILARHQAEARQHTAALIQSMPGPPPVADRVVKRI